MTNLSLNIRIESELEREALDKRAAAEGKSLSQYVRDKIAVPDLSPQLRGMVEQIARNFGKTPSWIIEEILLYFFARWQSFMTVYEAPDPEMQLAFGPLPPEKMWYFLLTNLTRQFQQEKDHERWRLQEMEAVIPKEEMPRTGTAKAKPAASQRKKS